MGNTVTVDMPRKTLPAAPLPTSPPLPTSALAVAPLAGIPYASDNTHMPTRPHLQAMRPPVFWVSEKRSGGVCTLRTPGSLSRNAPTPARPCLQATLLPFPHVMPSCLRLQAMHPPIPHAMPSHRRLQATHPPIPFSGPTLLLTILPYFHNTLSTPHDLSIATHRPLDAGQDVQSCMSAVHALSCIANMPDAVSAPCARRHSESHSGMKKNSTAGTPDVELDPADTAKVTPLVGMMYLLSAAGLRFVTPRLTFHTM